MNAPGPRVPAAADVLIAVNGALVGPDTTAAEIMALCRQVMTLPPAVQMALRVVLTDPSAATELKDWRPVVRLRRAPSPAVPE